MTGGCVSAFHANQAPPPLWSRHSPSNGPCMTHSWTTVISKPRHAVNIPWLDHRAPCTPPGLLAAAAAAASPWSSQAQDGPRSGSRRGSRRTLPSPSRCWAAAASSSCSSGSAQPASRSCCSGTRRRLASRRGSVDAHLCSRSRLTRGTTRASTAETRRLAYGAQTWRPASGSSARSTTPRCS